MKRSSWYLRMAWRDSRRNRGRLLLFIASVVIGIGALVSTLSFGRNLREEIDDQAKELLGADLVLRSRGPLPDPVRRVVDKDTVATSKECSFASMVTFVASGQSRLVQVRALEGSFPYYGALETTPVGAGMGFRQGREALVDKTVLLQYHARVGDSIRIGTMTFAIAGSLDRAPGRNELSTTIAPPVYIPFRDAAPAGLLGRGSRVEFQYYYAYAEMPNDLAVKLDSAGVRYETVETRKNRMSRSFGDLSEFLTLISFIALLMGCVGVASSVHIYIREKVGDIAVLRCLGLKARGAFLIYLLQIAAIGFIGSLAGVLLGIGIQQVLPVVLKDILPLEMHFRLSWPAIGAGFAAGISISLLFSLLPLLTIRQVSPLFTLRLSLEQQAAVRDPLRWLVYVAITGFILVFARLWMERWGKAIVFTLSVAATFLLLALAARLLMFLVRRLMPRRASYLVRQGFANLFRPKNQTLILVVTIGLGTVFIGTLYLVQRFLIDRVTVAAVNGEGNMVLFDIQRDQEKAVEGLTGQYRLPVLRRIPFVTVRIRGRELRVTYRDSLLAGEKVVAGRFGGGVSASGAGRGSGVDPAQAAVSVEERFARDWRVTVGDTLSVDVQGLPMVVKVGSVRRADQRRFDPIFPVVFPSGVLEQAPQIFLLITRVPTPEVSARFQRAIVNKFPNVSVIDLQLVLSILDDVLGKISFVIRFMAGFSMLTGIVVLIASVLISQFQRIKEMVLLRTLGATRRQVWVILVLEYVFLGSLAAATGILLSVGFSLALAKWIFEATLTIHWWPLVGIFVLVSGATAGIGLAGSRGVLRKPPLEVLRREE
jgi:putative ABC transport system permease protein